MELPKIVFETDSVSVLSRVPVSEKEIGQLVALCLQDGVAVSTATYRDAYYRSMRPNSNRQVVPFFQPMCFAIRKSVLQNIPFESVAAKYPQSWGTDIHWSILIRDAGKIIATNLVIVKPGGGGGGHPNPDLAKKELVKTLSAAFGPDWVNKYGKVHGFEETGWQGFAVAGGQKKKTCCGGL